MRRTSGALVAVCLSVTGVVVTAPPSAAETGPVVVDLHDSHAPAHVLHLSADGAATAYTDAGGRSYLVRGPLATTEPTVLRDGAPTSTDPYWVAARDEVRGGVVAMPVREHDGSVSEIGWCAVADCPDVSVLAVAEGLRYLGHGGDAALLYDGDAHALLLAPWDGGEPVAVPLGAAKQPYRAEGDATGVVLSNPQEVSYVDRVTGTVTVLGAGNSGRLTASYVVWANGLPASTIYRATRADLAAAPVTVHSGDYLSVAYFAATEAGVSFAAPGTRLATKTWAGPPVTLGYSYGHTVAPASDGTSFLVGHLSGTKPGLYLVTPGTTTKTFQHAVPPQPATPSRLAVANGRVAYVDDSTRQGALRVRAVDGATLGPESTLTTWATDAAISGSTTVFTRSENADGTVDVRYGRAGVAFREIEDLPTGGSSKLSVSGRRAVVSGVLRSWLLDTVTGRKTDLGRVRAAVFGDYLVTLSGDGSVRRRNLATGAPAQLVRGAVPACSGCELNLVSLAAWGQEVVYAFRMGTTPYAAHWDGTTGTTTQLPAVGHDTADVSYWDGLLAIGRHVGDSEVHSLRPGGGTAVITDSHILGPNAVDSRHVAYRATALRNRGVVQPVTDFFPAYAPSRAYYLGASGPRGFGPGLPVSSWRPAITVSEDVQWTLALHRGDATGPVVRTFTGTSAHGVIAPVWNGTTGTGANAPHGWYTWVLTGTGPNATPLTVPATGATTTSGRVFLSRVAPPTPTVTAPRLASDTGTDGRFTVRWSGAVTDTTYRVQRARFGLMGTPWATLAPATTARSMAVRGEAGTTYAFRVALADPAGRLSRNATAQTVVPFADAGISHGFFTGTGPWLRATGASFWGGAHRYTGSTGNSFAVNAYGDTLWLIGTKGPGHGRIDVTVDGDRRYVVDTYAATKRHRQVLFRVSGLTPGEYHRINVHVVGTPGRPLVSIDGLAARWLHY